MIQDATGSRMRLFLSLPRPLLCSIQVETAGAHQNVVTLHSSFVEGGHARLALDLASGDLFDYLWRRRGVS